VNNGRSHSLTYALRALGRRELPQAFCLQGRTYRHEATIKHDFWAATGFYRDQAGVRVVLKIGRNTPFLGLPYEWVGRWLCRREVRFYWRLADVPSVPPLLGTYGQTGFVHAYAAGVPLTKSSAVPDDFFPALEKLLAEIHRRQIAYVDTNKSPNILVGDDGKPYLIDFQISWDLHELGNTPLNRWWLKRLQDADRYHMLKHLARLRPQELTSDQRLLLHQRGWLIRTHRFFATPFRKLRHRIFKPMKASGKLLPEGSA